MEKKSSVFLPTWTNDSLPFAIFQSKQRNSLTVLYLNIVWTIFLDIVCFPKVCFWIQSTESCIIKRCKWVSRSMFPVTLVSIIEIILWNQTRYLKMSFFHESLKLTIIQTFTMQIWSNFCTLRHVRISLFRLVAITQNRFCEDWNLIS